MKHCNRCNSDKQRNQFYKHKASKDGLASMCRDCSLSAASEYNRTHKKQRAERHKKYYAADPEKFRRMARESRIRNPAYRVRPYGISLTEYERMYKQQLGTCAICRKLNVAGKRLSIDHDHKTNAVRGLLCNICNTILGMVNDDGALLVRAAEYLEAPRSVCGGYL